MGDSVMKCPLCCDKTFNNKPALVEHLTNVLGNITCPICSNKWSSLGHLIEHLTLDNCQPESTTDTLIFDIGPPSQTDIAENSSLILSEPKILQNDTCHNKNLPDPFSINQEGTDDGTEIGKMYVELLSKQLAKPCLQTQELKLVKDNGVSRYVIMTNEDSNLSVGSTVVTKQNNDGTISLTTVREMKMESDTVITQEDDTEDSQEEVYSCNTCGVSFTSVIDHIRSYHNDQDVVVEEPLDENGGTSMPIDMMEFVDDPLASDDGTRDMAGDASVEASGEVSGVTSVEASVEVSGDAQAPRRVITDNGDIVDAPMLVKTIGLDPSNPVDVAPVPQIKEELVDKQGRVYTRRYVQLDKFCDSIVKDIKLPDVKKGPYHKVVVKEMQTPGGAAVKVYNCMSCNIYVATLDEFKSHPCKALRYSCSHCSVSYENSKSLCAHMKVHKAKPGIELHTTPLIYECEVCCTVFPTNKSLKLHKRMHDPVKSRPIEPPVEGVEGAEVSQDTFVCPDCNKTIPVEYLAIHQGSHSTAEKFNCDICNKKFLSTQYLEMHMNVHNTDKVTVSRQDKTLPYRCLYCERRFARPHEKVKHERIHTGEKPHCCEICGKSFRVSYCLTLHMRTHTGARPYHCTHCGKRFKAHSVYNHHLLTHSDVRAYKCPYCPKAFKTSVQLAGHKNSHTKPFSCQHCNRPFASLYAVRVHTETHARQNNLKFSCKQCGASYARAFALKDHIKQFHKRDVDKDDDWAVTPPRADSDAEDNLKMTKDLASEMNELEMNSELIVP